MDPYRNRLHASYTVCMIVVDVEASGTEPALHSIVSVGALDFENPSERFYGECRIWDGAHVMAEALTVNGFSESAIRDSSKMSEAELYDAFATFALRATDHTFAGQNPSFDRDFLNAAAKRGHRNWPFAHRTIDVHTLCWMHMVRRGITPPINHNRTRLNLDAILNYTGIASEPEPHNALTGALCHAEVISRLVYEKKLLPEFDAFPIPWLEK